MPENLSSEMVEFLWIVLKEPIVAAIAMALAMTIIFAIVTIFNPMFKPKSISED